MRTEKKGDILRCLSPAQNEVGVSKRMRKGIDISNPELDMLTLGIIIQAGESGLTQDELFRSCGLDTQVTPTFRQQHMMMLLGQKVPTYGELNKGRELALAQSKVQISAFLLLMKGDVIVTDDGSRLVVDNKRAENSSLSVDLPKIYSYVARHKLRYLGRSTQAVDDPRIDYLVHHVIQRKGTDGLTTDEIYSRLDTTWGDMAVRQSCNSLLSSKLIIIQSHGDQSIYFPVQ